MKEIWTKDEPKFHGEFVNFDPIWSWPKPVQKPHPPVLLGGESGHTLQRVVDYCEGWFPRGRAADEILPGLKDLQARAAKAGRDMKTISVYVFGAAPEKPSSTPSARPASRASCSGCRPRPGHVLPMLDKWVKFMH